jgi:sugar lactone lactonase YvrE
LRRAAAALFLLAALASPGPVRADERGLDLYATIPEPDLIPEGIAFDPATRVLYVSSIRKRKIVALSPEGKVRDFVAPGQDGLWSVLGMKVDPERRTLLACSEVDGPGMLGYAPGDRGKSGVFEFDLSTGKTVRVFRGPPGRHLFNDLVFTRETIWVTDSEEGSVWRIDRRTGRLARLVPARRLVYPNGIAIDPKERTLFVADDRSIYAVDPAAGTRRELAHPPGTKLGQADGLYFDHGTLIAIQNGDPPVRIARFSLSPALDRVTGEISLVSGDPRFPEPTTAAVAGDVLYFVGDAQLRAMAKDGTLWPREKLAPVRIYEMALRAAPPSRDRRIR